MQLMLILLADTYVRGWMTVSGCTRATEARLISPKNGCAKRMSSWSQLLARLVADLLKLCVPAANVQTEKGKTR